jgi:hypothetical protein
VIKMIDTENAPIACSLAPGDYKARLAWISELARDALVGRERRGLELELLFAPDAAERVRDMVRMEQDCRGFLQFDLDEQPDGLRLTITAPERAREAADMLLAQFLPSAGARSACGCC